MMYFRPSRAVAFKLLGLWGTNQVSPLKNDDGDKLQDKSRFPIPPDNEQTVDQSLPDSSFAIKEICRDLFSLMIEKGIPGLTICVSKNNKVLWHSAFGFCDVENQVACEPDAKMRIASISKALFAATVIGPMVEQNKLDLEASIFKYLTEEEFPKPKFDGKERDIKVRQLLDHTSGVRHYEEQDQEEKKRPIGSKGSKQVLQLDDQYNRLGFYSRKTYRDVISALEPIKGHPLAVEPGTYRYTTYGYTLLSAVAQKAHQLDEKSKLEQIEDFWTKTLRRDWKLDDTSLDQDEPILSRRARYYMRTGENGSLINAPYQDSSVKWAGGGIISSTSDLVKFGNILIDSYKGRSNGKLKPETLERFWTESGDSSYGLGFQLKELEPPIGGDRRAIYHTGVALGASSILLMLPESGITVAILANIYSANMFPLALKVAKEFDKIKI